MIDNAEHLDEVQALWASVVGASPLPNVLADHCFIVGFCILVLHGLTILLYGLSVKR